MSEDNNTFDASKGAPIDGRIVITIGDGYKDAFLSIYHAENGGRDVSKMDVLSELSAKGIRYGVDNDAISRAIENRNGANYRIAKALPPVDGEDGTIEYLFPQNKVIAPKEAENGYVDYKDLGHIQNITTGTVIARITPPTEGVPGINIKNAPIKQTPGRKAPYLIGANTALSHDEYEIVASCDGHLRWESNKFVIDDVVTIQDVDASVGNIDFIGNVIVRGEVMEGFKVSSKKSITIKGNATGAIIEAGENLTIQLGSINSTIVCHGNVNTGFCENSKITCDGSLTSNSFITCDIYCGGELRAKGSKGVILGGKCVSLQDVFANSIGSDAFIRTEITIGDNAILTEEKKSNTKKIENLKQQIVMADQIIDILKQKKQEFGRLPQEREEMLTNTTRSKIQNQMEIGQLQRRIDEISDYLENRQALSAHISRTLYPEVTINIDDYTLTSKDIHNHCKVTLNDEGIAIMPL